MHKSHKNKINCPIYQLVYFNSRGPLRFNWNPKWFVREFTHVVNVYTNTRQTGSLQWNSQQNTHNKYHAYYQHKENKKKSENEARSHYAIFFFSFTFTTWRVISKVSPCVVIYRNKGGGEFRKRTKVTIKQNRQRKPKRKDFLEDLYGQWWVKGVALALRYTKGTLKLNNGSNSTT